MVRVKTQVFDPEVHAQVPLNWRNLTEREFRRLKKRSTITVTTLDGLEERTFAGFSENGLIETTLGSGNWGKSLKTLVGKHRVVVYSPQVENIAADYAYDS